MTRTASVTARAVASVAFVAFGIGCVAPMSAGAQASPSPPTTAPPTTAPPATTPPTTKPPPITAPPATAPPPTVPHPTAPAPTPVPAAAVLPAPTSAAAPTAAPSDPWIDVVAISIEYMRAAATLQLVTAQLATIQPRVAAADQAFRDADRESVAAKNDADLAVERMQRRAEVSYRQHGGSVGHVLEIDRTQELASASQYVQDATAVDSEEANRLTAIAQQRAAQREELAQEDQELALQQQQLRKMRDVLTARVQSDQMALDALGGVPVMGVSRLTGPQLAAWFTATGHQAVLDGATTIAVLAQIFIEEGAAEGVRGDVAFAQSIIETGFFRETRGNNYAGVGNCDSCGGRGYMFATPRDGVRAQIQLLRSYADPTSRASNLAYPPEPGLYGKDPVVAANKYDTFFLKGKVPLWNQMGHGKWATDPTYAGKVLTVHQRMLTFAATHS